AGGAGGNAAAEAGEAGSDAGNDAVAPDAPEDVLRASVTPAGRRTRKRPGHLALEVAFESRPEDPSLGTLVESTVRVNVAHPAYRRAAAARSEGYHIALTTAMALAPLAVEPADAQAFVTRFLAAWGEAGRNGRGA